LLEFRNDNQLDLFAWEPPTAIIIRHPGVFRQVWRPRISEIADDIESDPNGLGAKLLERTPFYLSKQLVAMGASDGEASREVRLYVQELLAELARRGRAMSFNPDVA
jgi:hypothetical protein